MNDFFTLLLPWQQTPNDQISDGFVYGILSAFIILLVIFLWKTIHRTRLIGSLTNKISKYGKSAKPNILHELKEAFDRNGELAEAWQEFEDSLITRQRDENQEKVVYKTDEASLFFSEERLLEQHLNLRFWNSVPALLVGVGILGTFVGLVWGLIPFSGIDFTQTDKIQEAIKNLLSGVSTAFVTSVWGMLTSLLFNGLEKWRVGTMSGTLANLQHALDQLFTLTTQEEISFRQEDELAQQTQALKSFSTDLADKIKVAMDNIMSEKLDNLDQGLTQLHDQSAQSSQEIVQELHNAPEAFSEAIAKQLEPTFNDLNAAVEELRREKEESSTDAIQQLVEEFQKSLSGSATAQMETLAETVSKASESLIKLPEHMAGIMIGVQEQVNQTRQLLSETSQDQTEQMKSMMDGMLNAFQNAIDTHQVGLSATTDSVNEEMKQIANDIRDLMDKTSAQSIQTLQTTIEKLQESITSTASQVTENSEAMINRMHELVGQSTDGLNTLLGQQTTQITAVNSQITNFQKTLEKSTVMLEKMDESVINVHQLIQTTKNLSGQLSVGTEELRTAGQKLTKASETFTQENTKYLTANREVVEMIEGMLEKSQDLLNKFGERFTTIDEGLNSIFAEIEQGLTNYSTTTRESINKYLSEFSDQLTQTAAALSSSVEALTDSVEELTEMNDQFTRRRGIR